jgi:hypothetical protein
MENPFLLAIALLETREITTRFLSKTRADKADSRLGVERPINWLLLIDDSEQSEIRPERISANSGKRSGPLGLQPMTGELACQSVSCRVICGRES